MAVINAGARLDRLPISSFHYRILCLIGAGMFLDAFDIYLQGAVLADLVHSGWSTPVLNADFISVTFAGMVVGAWFSGVLGDRFGRRYSYQFNLLLFGVASLVAALAPSMLWLIVARFFIGCGLGAEIVVGYVTLSEFLPPRSRGRWGTALAVITNSALFFSSLVARFVIPNWGWRWMFVLVGVGAVIVWYARKSMPESPRWLEAAGRAEEAEEVLARIEGEVARTHVLPEPEAVDVVLMDKPGVGALFSQGLLMRTITASVILIALNTAIYGFIAFLPTFMVKQGMTIVTSLNYTTLMSFGGPVGAVIGMLLADRAGRKRSIIWGSVLALLFGMIYPNITDPNLVTLVGFLLVTCVYVLVAIAWGLYVPELFPTDVRMRGAGFCNTAGRMMTIVTPQLIVPLYVGAGIGGVIGFVGALLVIQIVMVGLFGIETKKMSLEALVPRDEALAKALRSSVDVV